MESIINYFLRKVKRMQPLVSKKVSLLAVLSLLLVFTFNSCMKDDDNDSLDSWKSMGFIKKTAIDNFNYFIQIDNGDTLLPFSSAISGYEVTDSQRVIVNYSILENNLIDSKKYNVRLNSIKNVLYKNIIELTPENADSIGDDPIHISDIWVTGKTLNVEFRYFGGNTMHYINLTRQPAEFMPYNQSIELEFKHNANNDSSNYSLLGIVSFNLSELVAPGQDTVYFNVKAREYGNKYVTFTDLKVH